MTTLMISAGPGAPDTPGTRFGGVPLAPAGTDWPRCAACDGFQQFQAQIALDDLPGGGGRGVLALFQCQNDPGVCEEWDPEAGGNRALLLPSAGLAPMPLPEGPGEEVLVLGAAYGVRYEEASEDYLDALGTFKADRDNPRDLLGQLGGTPSWLQGEEEPECGGCGKQMPFVAQLEEGPDHETAANFGGGGCAYAFACEPCGRAAFLWQC